MGWALWSIQRRLQRAQARRGRLAGGPAWRELAVMGWPDGGIQGAERGATVRPENRKSRPLRDGLILFYEEPAATYSPRDVSPKYHRRRRA